MFTPQWADVQQNKFPLLKVFQKYLILKDPYTRKN